jgi:hypothetical protein
MKKIVKYNNLGQITTGRLVYFRSTDVEQKNYHRLLWSVPDEFLFHFYKGNKIIINDISKHRKGKIERIFIPVLRDLLNSLYLGLPIENKNLSAHYNLAKEALLSDKSLKRKYLFWKGKIKNKIEIEGKTIRKTAEPNLLNLVRELDNKE